MPNDYLGPVAETYDQLQGVEHLSKARLLKRHGFHSNDRAKQAVFQCAAIAFYNLSDLYNRISRCICGNDLDRSANHIVWAHELHHILIEIFSVVTIDSFSNQVHASSSIDLNTWSALKGFLKDAEELDTFLFDKFNQRSDFLKKQISLHSNASPSARFIQYYRTSSHLTEAWHSTVRQMSTESVVTDIDQWIGSTDLQAAVKGFTIPGDTYFLLFRCLHQIPELAADAALDSVAQSCYSLTKQDWFKAVHYAREAVKFAELPLVSLRPLLTHLSPHEYYKIRSTLGLTSGSHSRALRYWLFGDAIQELTAVLETATSQSDSINAQSFVVIMQHHVFELQFISKEWRELHLGLPKNVLGGFETRSLVGAPDAVSAARAMKDAAASRYAFTGAEKLHGESTPVQFAPVDTYNRERSFDRLLRGLTASVVQERFSNVQNRTGWFAKQPKFRHPPKWKWQLQYSQMSLQITGDYNGK